MKFSESIIVNRSRDIVTKYFVDPQHLKEYQEGFIKKEVVSGTPGQAGAISKMYYQNGKHKIELTETIKSNQLPDSFEASYHFKHMDNTMKCNFIAFGDNQTRYDTEVEYTRINTMMLKLVATLFPSMYKKPVLKWMNNFKKFVESQ